MPESPPSLPGTLSRPDAQRIIDALNLRIWELERKPVIAGVVKANGEKEAGEEFTSEKTGAGAYKITLSTELAAPGVVVATAYGGAYARSAGASKKVFEVFTAVPNTGVQTDAAFGFMIKVP